MSYYLHLKRSRNKREKEEFNSFHFSFSGGEPTVVLTQPSPNFWMRLVMILTIVIGLLPILLLTFLEN